MNKTKLSSTPLFYSLNITLQRNFAKKTKQAQKEEDEVKKEKIRSKFQDLDFQELKVEWNDNFDY